MTSNKELLNDICFIIYDNDMINDENDLNILHSKLKTFLAKKNIRILDIFFCPHHPTSKIEKYNHPWGLSNKGLFL